jgi:prepilin-type N-terminal cleavage/methylation domain-containing protein
MSVFKICRLVRRKAAFTLAEILIVLGVLAVIATFTIPKAFNPVQTTLRASVLKQALTELSQITYESYTKGTLNKDTFYNQFRTKLQFAKECPNNISAEGCWNGSPIYEGDKAGFVLHNGAVLSGFSNYFEVTHNSVSIDYNGVLPPNKTGEDQLNLTICFTTSGFCNYIAGNANKKGGIVGPNSSNGSPELDNANFALWQTLAR